MEETAKMKNGESFDLLARLAREKEFGMTESEMQKLLDPAMYIGRCAEQVEALVKKTAPLLSEVSGESAKIEL